MAKKKFIKIIGINDVYNFIRQASLVDGDVDVTRGKHSVDGKSALGMFSINPADGVTVTYPEDAHEFESYLESIWG